MTVLDPIHAARRTGSLLIVLSSCAAASAQDLIPKGAPQTRPIVLEHVVVHTMDGRTILDGRVLFTEGVIRSVLTRDDPMPRLAGEPLVVDCGQKHLYPGLVAAFSQLGLLEIGMVRQTVDTDELGEFSPEAMAAVAVNPDSAALPVARTNGVLVAGVFPTGGLIPGRASAIQLDGWTNADMTLLEDAGVVVDWPMKVVRERRRGPDPTDRRGRKDPEDEAEEARHRIDEEFARARAWLDRSVAEPTTPPDLRARSLVSTLRGERAVFLLADELEQIESAVLWAVGRGLRPVVVGGRDALACKDLLVRHAVPVVVTGTHELPARDDLPYDAPFALPAQLAKAGIPFCIATGEEFSNERNLPFHAATAAAFGLDRDRALAAITRDAATILGVGDRVGTIAPGKDATLILCDGNPLDLTTRVEKAWIQGREVDLRNKQTELARKYREKYRQLRQSR